MTFKEKAKRLYELNKEKEDVIVDLLTKVFLWNELKRQIGSAKKVVIECKMLSIRTGKDLSAHEYLGQENAYDQVLHFMAIFENQLKEKDPPKQSLISRLFRKKRNGK